MGAWKTVVVCLAAAACVAFATEGARAGEREARSLKSGPVRIRDPFTAFAVRGALRGAARRLEEPQCQQLFEDFKDGEGRSLQENLAALGETGGSYMEKMLFYDGASVRRCDYRQVLAVTQPGSRVVFVCARAFGDTYRMDTRMAEAILIHEALHSLGLGENPPSSREITQRVMSRCRR